jgi:hypothetical protein
MTGIHLAFLESIHLAPRLMWCAQEGADLAAKFNLPFFETSAKADIRVAEAYKCLIDSVCKYVPDAGTHARCASACACACAHRPRMHARLQLRFRTRRCSGDVVCAPFF